MPRTGRTTSTTKRTSTTTTTRRASARQPRPSAASDRRLAAQPAATAQGPDAGGGASPAPSASPTQVRTHPVGGSQRDPRARHREQGAGRLVPRRITAQRKRQDRAELATVAAVVAKQVQDSFGESVDLLESPAAKAALNAAPLLLLPGRKKDGVGGYLTDPKFIGVAAVAAAAFIGDQQNKSTAVGDARITGAAEIDEGDETVVIVDVFDKQRPAGRPQR